MSSASPPATTGAAAAASARIHDQGYRPFEGPRGAVHTRWWAIAGNELRQAWKSRWFRRLLWAAFFPLGVFGVLVLVRGRLNAVLGPAQLWPEFWKVQLFFGVVAVYFTGRGAVGEDLRTGALGLYFARPVDFRQYLLGKWAAVALASAGVLAVPGLVLALFRLAAEPGTGALAVLGWAASLLLLALGMALCGGWVMLAVSALVGRGRAAGIVWIVLYFASSAAGLALAGTTGIDALGCVGIGRASQSLAGWLFGSAGPCPPAAAAAGLLGWTALGLGLTVWRLRRWRRR